MDGLGTNDVLYQADRFPRADDTPRHVVFPPSMSMHGRAGLGVVVVMPTLAMTQESDQPVISTLIASFVVLITEHVSD